MHDQLNALLILFCRLISTRRLYFHDHPKVMQMADDFFRMLQDFFSCTETSKLFIGMHNGSLIHEGHNLVGPSVIGRQLFQFAANLKCGGISFAKGLTKRELIAFIDLAGNLEKPLPSIKEARQLIEERSVHNIEIAANYVAPDLTADSSSKVAWEGQEQKVATLSPTLIYQALFDMVAQAHENGSRGKEVDYVSARSVSEYMLHFTKDNFADLLQNVQYPDHDTYTVGHSVRVAALSVYFGSCCNWTKEQILAIGTAGLLHDIGKSRIPSEILHKAGALTNEEFSQVTAHSRLGAEILLSHPESSALEVTAAWGHHIKNDGTGYPAKPSWAARHPLIALLQICDVFEALTASRPYKPPLTPQMAYGIMLQDKQAFHLNLLASFISVLGLYPPGNTVLLSDNRRATVTAAANRIDRPTVRITHDRNGEELSADQQQTIALDDENNSGISVRQLLLPHTPPTASLTAPS